MKHRAPAPSRRTALAGLLALCAAAPGRARAAARAHALLVAVSEVARLPRRLHLRGPDNDAALMREVLLARGFEPASITMLARRAKPADGPPTYAAVRSAMAALAQRVQPHDAVVLHLAGHGTQAPQPPNAPNPEPDGMDEIFLLEDTQPWDATQQRLPNALMDDEIGVWIDSLVDRGARVLAIFDTCHAGGMAREGVAGPARWRAVGGAELGIPSLTTRSPAPTGTGTGTSTSTSTGTGGGGGAPTPPEPRNLATAARMDGRVLAFAARTHELAGEEWLPRGGTLARTRMHGLFSFELAQALRGGVNSAQALRAALRLRYGQEGGPGGAGPTPLIVGEGELLR